LSQGRSWIDTLPDAVAPQAAVLRRLLEAAEADPRIRALRIRGSFARGDVDEHSDLDTMIWIVGDEYDSTLADLPSLVRSLGPTIDVLFDTPGSPYLFGQFADGVQLELSTTRASAPGAQGLGVVVLLDRDGLLRRDHDLVPAWDESLWLGWAWIALSDVDKYLRRDSLWEALTTLEKARSLQLRHHAKTIGMPDPEYGVTSILDFDGALPDRLEETVAGLDAGDIRRAACACGELLSQYERRPFTEFVLERLTLGA
jgi:predicted nucleotidyltransferase